MSNKGLKLLFCKECKRKRYCREEYLGHHLKKWICSKKHFWVIEIPSLEKVTSVLKECFTKEIVINLFNRDDTFFRALENKTK